MMGGMQGSAAEQLHSTVPPPALILPPSAARTRKGEAGGVDRHAAHVVHLGGGAPAAGGAPVAMAGSVQRLELHGTVW